MYFKYHCGILTFPLGYGRVFQLVYKYSIYLQEVAITNKLLRVFFQSWGSMKYLFLCET